MLDVLAPLKHSAWCSSEGSVQTKGLHQEVALATWSLRGFWTRYLEDPFYWSNQAVKRPAALWKHWQRSGFPFSCQGTQVLSHLSMLHNLAIWTFDHVVIRSKLNVAQCIAFILTSLNAIHSIISTTERWFGRPLYWLFTSALAAGWLHLLSFRINYFVRIGWLLLHSLSASCAKQLHKP